MKQNISKLLAGLFGLALAGVGAADAATINVPAGKLVPGSQTWTTGNEYILQGFVYVMPGQTLTIQPGVVVKGIAGSGVTGALDFGALFVTRGATINAQGTRGNPIIFTAEVDDVSDPADVGPYTRGLWGGLVIFGNTVLNSAVNNAGHAATPKYEVYEGLPDTVIDGVNVHRYGGNNDADNSGTLRYISLRHGGNKLSADKEINGLSLGAVGSGTTIEYVEVYGFADDGFEFFGGTVNTKYLASVFNDDDSFDTDMGFRSKHQYWFGLQHKDARDDLGELNGQLSDRASEGAGTGGLLPHSNWQVRNATLIGPSIGSGGSGNVVHNARVYGRHQFYNSIMTQTAQGGISVADATTAANIPVAPFSGGLEYHGNIFWRTVNVNATAAAAPFAAAPWVNTVTDPLLNGISWIPDYGLDPTPQAGSPALGGVVVPPVDAFYDVTTYRGAFGANDYWLDGWTYLWERGFLNIGLNSAYNPATDTTTVSFRTVTGVTYRLQQTVDGDTFIDVGAPVVGDGTVKSVVLSPSPAKATYRVRRG